MGIGLPEIIVVTIIGVLTVLFRVLPLVILIFAYRRLGQVGDRMRAIEGRLTALELRAMAERTGDG